MQFTVCHLYIKKIFLNNKLTNKSSHDLPWYTRPFTGKFPHAAPP